MKKFKFLILVLLICALSTSANTIYSTEEMENKFTRKLIDNVIYFSIYQKAFSSNLLKKYPNAKTSQTECYNLIKDYMNYTNLTNSVDNTLRDSDIKAYCTPENIKSMLESAEDLKVRYAPKYIGYHDSDDKSGFWIPSNINPVMKSNSELEKYRIANIKNFDNYINSIDYYSLSKMYFCTEADLKNKTIQLLQEKINSMQVQNRPLIVGDLQEVKKDVEIYFKLKSDLKDLGPMDYDVSKPNGFGRLTPEGEKQLKSLTMKYGEKILDEEFKKRLNLYRERQKAQRQQQQQESVNKFFNTLLGI